MKIVRLPPGITVDEESQKKRKTVDSIEDLLVFKSCSCFEEPKLVRSYGVQVSRVESSLLKEVISFEKESQDVGKRVNSSKF